MRLVWASLWHPAPRAYRAHAGVSEEDLAMAVVVMRLVDSRRAGVVFTVDPAGAPGALRLEAVDGLAEQLVSGEVTPEAHVIARRRASRMSIDPTRRKVVVDEEEVQLTAKEFDLLFHFASQPGRVFTRDELLEKIWGYEHSGYEHTVNSHINRLRLKVEQEPRSPRYIVTVWGVGYRFAEPEELQELRVSKVPGQDEVELTWLDVIPTTGSGTTYEVAGDSLGRLRLVRSADGAWLRM